jgi:hypothetical protein
MSTIVNGVTVYPVGQTVRIDAASPATNGQDAAHQNPVVSTIPPVIQTEAWAGSPNGIPTTTRTDH